MSRREPSEPGRNRADVDQWVHEITARLAPLARSLGEPARWRPGELAPAGGDGREGAESPLGAAARGAAPYPGGGKIGGEIAPLIDHTLLAPQAARQDIVKLCDEALAFGFASVCVNSVWVPLARARLGQAPVAVCATAAFPLGAEPTAVKSFAAAEAVACGAGEIDMVIHIGALKSGDYESIVADIHAVVAAARPARVKVILECGLLDWREKVAACVAAKLAGAAFVKTSTGFAGSGATTADVELMRRVVGDGLGVKAAGGIRSATQARQMIAAGATRIGSSASVTIVSEGAGAGREQTAT